MSFFFWQWKFCLPTDAGRIRQEASCCLPPKKIRKNFWKIIDRIPCFTLRDMVDIAKFVFNRFEFTQFKFTKEVYNVIDHCLEILDHIMNNGDKHLVCDAN